MGTKGNLNVQVGVKNKTNEVQSKLSNVILVDANKNQVSICVKRLLPTFNEDDISFS